MSNVTSGDEVLSTLRFSPVNGKGPGNEDEERNQSLEKEDQN
jgi:hypothetical protein